jgi:DAACS family dicarboxylate/amino acid:cation (Na+ or H+) symporter
LESAHSEAPRVKNRLPLHWKILIGLTLGAALGLASNLIAREPVIPGVENPVDLDANGIHDRLDWAATNIAHTIGRLFLRLMFMIVLPLVFSALALAVVEIGDVRRLGKIGARTLIFTAALSSMAVLVGITLVNLIRPGNALPEGKRDLLERRYAAQSKAIVKNAQGAKTLRDILIDVIPENPIQEMVGAVDGSSKGNGMLAVMFFSLMVGAAMAASPERTATLVNWLEGLNAVAMTIIGWAMRLAPLGAGCLVFWVTATLGFDVLISLFWFAATVLGGLAIHLFVVYSALVALFSRFSPRAFFSGVAEVMQVAFGTSSSNATLPTALRVADEKLQLPRESARFVLTVGATGNQNGTALYEGVVVLFLAQVFSVELALTSQLKIVLMSILAGIGTAGVPGGSLPLIVVLLGSVGVPGEAIGIILGIDRLLDMCRTVVNVTGDLAVAACVAGKPLPGAAGLQAS